MNVVPRRNCKLMGDVAEQGSECDLVMVATFLTFREFVVQNLCDRIGDLVFIEWETTIKAYPGAEKLLFTPCGY